ncbi:MAG: hypothetical protein ABIS27_00065 [Longimicrobiales bacterium]
MSGRRVTYRELRNTPGKVFERLANGEPLELVADGDTKALLIPVDEGDATSTLDAWKRGRALLALSRVQSNSRRKGTPELKLSDITSDIKAARRARRSLVEVAIAGAANAIVTGNTRHFIPKNGKLPIAVLTPRQLIDRLRR